jgi:hypothetical protein
VAAALLLTASLTACTSSAEDQRPLSASAQSQAPASPDASSSAPGGGIALGGDEVPPGWPEGLPVYAGGRLLSAVVTEDGRNVNASWASDESADQAWAAMDAALRGAGLVPAAETGAESMLVEDETQRSDLYLGSGLEANLIVVKGNQTTVLLNASRL